MAIDRLYDPEVADLENYARMTGNGIAIPVWIHLDALAGIRDQAMDVRAEVELRPGMAPLVSINGLAPTTWERRVPTAARAAASEMQKCTCPPRTARTAPAARPATATPTPAPTAAPARPAHTAPHAPAPAATPTPTPAHAPTCAPAAAASHDSHGGHEGTGTASSNWHGVRNIALVLFAIAVLFLLANIATKSGSRGSTKEMPVQTQQATDANAKPSAGSPAGMPGEKARPHSVPDVPAAKAEKEGITVSFLRGCTPTTGGMMHCEGILRNTGNADTYITFLAPRVEDGQQRGWASGSSAGITPIELWNVRFVPNTFPLGVTIPAGGAAQFVAEFKELGSDNASYKIDLAIERDGQVTYLDIDGVPVAQPAN